MTAVTLASLVEGFFLGWLGRDRKASPNTIAAYRDAFRLFFEWLEADRGVAATSASVADVAAGNVSAFLASLEEDRGCSPATVNCRLTAFQSFARYAARRDLDRLAQYRAITEIPRRKQRRREVDYLTPEEVGWLLGCCEPGSATELMVAMLYNTGARISELVTLTGDDVRVVPGGRCHVHFLGKGRKDRTLPMWEDTSRLLIEYMRDGGVCGGDYVFKGRNVDHLTRSGARSRIDAVVAKAAASHPELKSRSISPHTFRHACAMAMLYAGVDIATVAIWLGHESVNTTHKYVVTNMAAKEEALAKVRASFGLGTTAQAARYKAPADVLEFLNSL